MFFDIIGRQSFVQKQIGKLARAVKTDLAISAGDLHDDPALEEPLEVYGDIIADTSQVADKPDDASEPLTNRDRISEQRAGPVCLREMNTRLIRGCPSRMSAAASSTTQVISLSGWTFLMASSTGRFW